VSYSTIKQFANLRAAASEIDLLHSLACKLKVFSMVLHQHRFIVETE